MTLQTFAYSCIKSKNILTGVNGRGQSMLNMAQQEAGTPHTPRIPGDRSRVVHTCMRTHVSHQSSCARSSLGTRSAHATWPATRARRRSDLVSSVTDNSKNPKPGPGPATGAGAGAGPSGGTLKSIARIVERDAAHTERRADPDAGLLAACTCNRSSAWLCVASSPRVTVPLYGMFGSSDHRCAEKMVPPVGTRYSTL